jgi:class 3 adenylate cyclase
VGGIEDIAHPVLFEHNPHEGIEVECIVAFADIRGFTKWVLNNKSQKVQDLIFDIEKVLQKHFAKRYFSELFIKGVGDGFMVVLEKDRYEYAVSELKKKNFHVSRGFVPDFITACYDCGNELIPMLKEKNLKIGFGVEIGKLKNVLVLGRWDYLGQAVNDAAKYQNKASNSMRFSKKCFSKMNEFHELLKGIKDKKIIITSGKNKKQVAVKELKLKETIKGEGNGG